MLKKFNQLFSIPISKEEEMDKFVQRVNQTIFSDIKDNPYPASYESIFKNICYYLGINHQDEIRKKNRDNYGYSLIIPSLRSLTNDDFYKTLKMIVLLYKYFDDNEEWKNKISKWVTIAISNAEKDLGIRWSDGMFYSSGAEFLDEHLIDDIIGVLQTEDRKAILIAYKKGLKEFWESRSDRNKFKNVIRDMQLSLDEASKVLISDKNVGFQYLLKDKKWDKIIANKYYQKIFFQLNELADKLVKHKSDEEFDIIEIETFIYLTGIFLRVAFIK